MFNGMVTTSITLPLPASSTSSIALPSPAGLEAPIGDAGAYVQEEGQIAGGRAASAALSPLLVREAEGRGGER